jgi:alanine dehydrogenase
VIDVKVGIPREVKNNEFRVAITPAGVHELARHGHQVVVERNAGAGSSITDDEYIEAGAAILPTADDVWAAADLLLKVKEPVPEEYHRLRKGQTLFTYLHLAASRACTDALLASGTTAIAYETVETAGRTLPLLAPMSEVAGRLAPQVGAYHLMSSAGGRGVLPGGVPGTAPGRAVVIGGGVSGWNATQIAVGMGFHVTLLDKDINKLREADRIFGTKVQTIVSNTYQLERAVIDADLVVGAVLIPGAKAPKLVTNDLVARMKSGSVLVDIAIDQGGCFEDSRPTTHAEPTFRVHDSVFYCVANMPGAVPSTSTYALTNATLPYIVELADRGWREALRRDPVLAKGLNTHEGQVVYREVAEAHGLDHVELGALLG